MATFVVFSILYVIVAMAIAGGLEKENKKYLSYIRAFLCASSAVVFVALALCSFFGGGWETSSTIDTPSNYHNPKGRALLGFINLFISIGPYGVGLICLFFAFGSYGAFKDEQDWLKQKDHKPQNNVRSA